MLRFHYHWIALLILSLCFTSCARWKGGPERFNFGHYSEAEKLYNKGEYAEAIKEYQAYIDENPEGNLAVIAEYYIGKSYVSLEQPDEAKTIFQKVIQEHPDSTWAKFSETQIEELEQAQPQQPAAS